MSMETKQPLKRPPVTGIFHKGGVSVGVDLKGLMCAGSNLKAGGLD